MSDRIFRHLSKDDVLRLREWAARIGDTPLPTSWPTDGPIGDGCKIRFYQARLPRIVGRAHDTDMAIAELPNRYSQAVRQFWLFEGRSLRWHGQHRGVSYHTFEAWVIKAHELLKSAFARQSERWHREHEHLRQQRAAADRAVARQTIS